MRSLRSVRPSSSLPEMPSCSNASRYCGSLSTSATQPETAPGKFKIQVPSAQVGKGKGVRADADVRTESDRDYHAVTQFSHHATSHVPIPFEVLWREVCECGLRPLVAAAAHVQPGSGYVRLALPPDLSRE